jgi:large subunit ribosomal protein L5
MSAEKSKDSAKEPKAQKTASTPKTASSSKKEASAEKAAKAPKSASAEETKPGEESAESHSDSKTVVRQPRMQVQYRETIVPAMMKEFGYANVMQVPRMVKVSVNIGLGEAIQNSKAIEAATGDLALITGQKAVVTKARRSVAVFKLREGMPIGAMVTMRGNRMWDFIDRLINIVLPRQRDFQGVSPDSFDGRGNYSIGLREQLVFPEIEYDKVDKVRGLEVTIVTTAETDEEARRMLAMMGMPFKR